MDTNHLLQVMVAELLVVGLLSLAAFQVAALPFVLAGETVFLTEVIAVSVGLVGLVPLRRRSRETPRQVTDHRNLVANEIQ